MDNDPLIDSEAGRPNAATSKAAKTKPSRQACYVVLALIALVLVGGISMAPRWRRRRTGASDWLLTDVPAPRPLRAIPAATPVGIIVWQTQPAAPDNALRFMHATVASEEYTCSTIGRDVRVRAHATVTDPETPC